MKSVNKEIRKAAVKKNLLSKASIAHGVGRRKTSVARVFLSHGTGKITLNKREFEKYLHTDLSRKVAVEPIVATETSELFDIKVNVFGGGIHSQAGAVKLGISRALAKYNEDYKKLLRDKGFLTVDSRVKERKKYGQPGARKKFQFVKR
jgi:small subunit ribosomal protein S9